MKKKFIFLLVFSMVFIINCEEKPTVPREYSYGIVTGLIKDEITDKPLVGARVGALLNQVEDTTDSLGEYFLDSLIVGNENIIISADYYDSKSLEITITPDTQQVSLSLIPSLEDLYVYVAAQGGNNIFIVDVDSKSRVDSLYFSSGTISDILLSPEGTKLYIRTENSEKIFYLDTITRTFQETNLPYGKLYVSPYDNNIYLLTATSIYTVDSMTDVAVQIDTITSNEILAFSPVAPVFYFKRYAYQRSYPLYVYDYQQARIIDSLRISATEMEITPNGEEIYFFGAYFNSWDYSDGRLSLLGVWDLSADTLYEIVTLFDTTGSFDNLAFWNGKIAITPDGQHVLVTEFLESGIYTGLVDISVKGIVRVINTRIHDFENHIDLFPLTGYRPVIYKTVITPSGRYAFANNGYSRIYIIDLVNRVAIKEIKFNNMDGNLRPMVIGSKN